MLNINHDLAEQKIRLQDTARLFRVAPHTIVNRAGRSLTIRDDDEFLYTALRALDGTRSLRATYEALPQRFRDLYVFEMMLDVVRQLDAHRLFENVSRLEDEAMLLSEYEVARWNRNFEFFNAFCPLRGSKLVVQKRIRDARIVLLGVGGVGTHALLDLVSLGFSHIKAVDFDKIELSNLNRQILYGESDVGRKKIDAAKDAIERYIGPNRHDITFHDIYLDGPQAIAPLVQGADVVIACVDRPTNVVSWINEACVKAGVPFTGGGVDTTRTCTYTIIPGKSGCIECWRRSTLASGGPAMQRIMDLELSRDVGKLPPRPAIVNLVSVQVGFLMSEVLKIVTGIAPPSAVNKLVAFDFETMRTADAETWERDVGCPVCSSCGTNPEI